MGAIIFLTFLVTLCNTGNVRKKAVIQKLSKNFPFSCKKEHSISPDLFFPTEKAQHRGLPKKPLPSQVRAFLYGAAGMAYATRSIRLASHAW